MKTGGTLTGVQIDTSGFPPIIMLEYTKEQLIQAIKDYLYAVGEAEGVTYSDCIENPLSLKIVEEIEKLTD